MFSHVKSITFVQNVLALILLGLVLLFILGSENFGYIIGKNLVASLLGGLLAYLYGKYMAEISDFTKEKESLFQELEDAYLRQLSLLDDMDADSHQEEILIERNEGLAKDLTEERYRVDELFKVIDEYETRLRKAESEKGELKTKNEDLEHQTERLQRDLVEKESQIVASMETLSVQKGKNEILAEEVLVMKNWIAELAGEKEKLKDLLVEKELEMSSVRQHMEDEKDKNHVLAEEGKVLKNWIAELAGENVCLRDKLAEKEREENAITKVSEMLDATKEKVFELESTLQQVQERLRETEENACEEEFHEDKEGNSQEENEDVEAESPKENLGYSQEENGHVEDLERQIGNQQVEVTQEKKESCEEEEGTKLENKESPKNNGEENKQQRTKKKRGKKRKKPARQEDSMSTVVQSVALQTHSENLHSIMLPAELQEVLQKNEKGLAFITCKNKVLLNFMHHDKASVRAVLSRCSRSTAEEVLVDLQKLVLSALTKN